ncbi:VCBS repeat-containing protein [Tenacibaculum aiptasiae]|uniref:VCBS repeat-containing protein n=1 Tax=Tenacibaculum aiptasiae TaxID=426481 RepID=A0A7J5ANX3_9FLAO|nr:VCBS repeat-containing protein [Tenacibaculum aiptasiae]KAB1158699.1 VCBS repeat-containing protein [Tenacibaculum aiptasiae]
MRFPFLIIIVILFVACTDQKSTKKNDLLFNELKSNTTGIRFENNLTETDSLNYFKYTSIYMGGGVAAGDINNDGLVDLFFTGNQVKNRLYLNKGSFSFEDISEKAKIEGDSKWYTGVTMADVNADGYLDIYCSVSGKNGDKRNELYINNRDNTFTERAKEYQIDALGNSVQATFFDFDNDGDLDLYVANYPIAHPTTSNAIYDYRMKNVSDEETDKLYRNEGKYFIDVTEISGVKNYSFSLGVVAADLNNDGWQDLYVSNDYSIPDFLYINNQDGTFKEVIKEATSQTSFYGMGIDIADINNDELLDVFQVDMESNNNRRQKANMASMNPRLFYETVLYGFHYQYMHNCLQLNVGSIENNVPKFSNISRISGTSSTDWSWGPMFADFDNDGFKDLYITNGTRREVNNKDFFKKIDGEEYKKYSLLEKTKMIPSEKIDNFMFKNVNGIQFERVNKKWGIEHKGFSNGWTYADLDNDGDLDVVINNLDEIASVFENKGNDKNYLSVSFKGTQKNPFGLGAKVYTYVGKNVQKQELTLTRGFQSSVAPKLHFGLGDAKKVDSLKVVWPRGKEEVLKGVKTNQSIVLKYANAEKGKDRTLVKKKIFSNENSKLLAYKSVENDINDFDKQVLLPHKMSTLGPAVAVADVNNDGLEDCFVGGSFGNEGRLFIQKKEGFYEKQNLEITKDKLSEDLGALFFDADNDGDQDLYVVSGGYEYAEKSTMLQDRLYVNDGKGNFQKEKKALPQLQNSGSRVYKLDFNKDGKQDVLVLGRQVPGKYPLPTSSSLLENASDEKSIKFNNVTSSKIPLLKNLGMATSAVVTDINNDGWEDIIIVGEWMSIKVFVNHKGKFEEISGKYGLTKNITGWWWSINQGDFDNDGDMDYIVGNNGLNYKYKATEKETFDIYVNDFDKNNENDIVLSYYNEGKQYPVRGKQCSSQQIPSLKSKFKNYNEFSTATLVDVYGSKNLENSLHYQVSSFASIYLENKEGKLIVHELPIEAQFSSINQIIVNDFNDDGNLDAVVAGNLYNSEVETPRNDGSYGVFLEGNGKGKFKSISTINSGLFTEGDVKDLVPITVGNQKYIISVKNNDYLQFIKINN